MTTQLIPNYETGKYLTNLGDIIDINELELKQVHTGFSVRVKTSPNTAQYDPSEQQWVEHFGNIANCFGFDFYMLLFDGPMNANIKIVTSNFYREL